MKKKLLKWKEGTQMKKAAYLLLILVLCLSLCACGDTNNIEVDDTMEETPVEEVIQEETIPEEEVEEALPPEPTGPVFVDPEKTTSEELDEIIVSQGNRHGLNAFCYDNSWIYGTWAGSNYTGEIAKVRYDNSDWTVIDSDTNGKYAFCRAVNSGYIYYSQEVDVGFELIKVRSSGEDAKVIIPSHYKSIQIVDNFIYYTTPEFWNEDNTAVTEESCHLYRCNLDGENVEEVLGIPVYYFTVFEDYILYQDDKDDMTLHIYNMVSGEDKRINDQRSFGPIYDGNYIYYMSDSGSPEIYQQKLWRLSLDGTINEEIDLGCYVRGILLRGDYIYYINDDDNSRIYRCLKDGSEIELVTQDANVDGFQWVNSCLAYMTRNEEGYIDGFFLCDADGADKIEFCKSDDYWYLG